MNKKTKYAQNGALIFGIANAILNATEQLKASKNNPNSKFDWTQLFAAAGKGALFGGGCGLGVGAIKDFNNSLMKPSNIDPYLQKLADKVRLDKQSPKYKLIDEKARLLSGMIINRFRDKLAGNPERLGSTEKGTALQQKFDIDLSVKFKHNGFASTVDMRFALLKFLKSKVGTNQIVEVREQRSSIGVLFNIEGKEYRIDIVPIKITEGNKHSGYLSVSETSILSNNYSRQKTNIKVLNSIRLSETQRRIILVLKHWRIKNDVPIGSHLLENLVLDAYAYARTIPNGFTKKVVMVLKHIANNLEVAVIRGAENTNNVITDIDQDKKQKIIAACKNAVEEYEYQPNNIKTIF
jgi:hypothetical protein